MLKKKILILIGICVAVVVAVFSAFKIVDIVKSANVSSIASNFRIIANNMQNNEVAENTEFTITSKIDYSVAEMRNKISLTDDLRYDLTKIRSNEYLLKPLEKTNKNIFNISIVAAEDEPALSWAFQNAQNFEITRTIPANGSDYVPTNSGIEIEFSKIPETMNGYFEISPAVEGRYESNGKSLIFVPKKLAVGTEYTVTVKKGVKSKFGDELKQDYSFKFKVGELGNELYLEAENNTVRVNGEKFIKVNSDVEFNNERFKVKVYSVNTAKDYLTLLKNPNKVNKLAFDLVSEFETQFIMQEINYYMQKYIMLPETLPEGQYMVEISTGGGIGKTKNMSATSGLQVTDVATYIQSFNGETLVWCNDIAKNEVLKGAKVEIADKIAETDENGIAVLKVSLDEKQDIVITTLDGRKYIAYEYLEQSSETVLSDLYYTYIYTDREIYMPTDTLKFWGMILPKNEHEEMPKQVKIKFGEDILEISVGAQGNFSGEYSFENRISGYLTINIEVNGKEKQVCNKQISEYVKPTYNITSEFDRKYYKRGEKVTVNIKAEFFDETPANNIQLSTSISSHDEDVVTDILGNAKVSFTPMPRENSSWMPYYLYSTVRTSGGEEDAYSENYVKYFPTGYMLDAKWENNLITLNCNEINIKDKNGEKYEKGNSANVNGTIKIIKEESIAKENGEYYDFINKKNVKKYTYSTQRTEIEQIPFSTYGVCEINTAYTKEDNVNYFAEVYYVLPDGFNGKATTYLYSYNDNYQDGFKRYSFEEDEYRTYKGNEKIELTLDGDVKETGRALYTVFTDRIQKSGVITDTKLEIDYLTEYIPRVGIAGVYFDGEVLYPISYKYFYFDKDEKKLDINISTDKESYKLNEKVKVSVTVKDKNGVGKKTNVVLSVVDEAVFALWEQYPNPLGSLYDYRYYTYVQQYVSHEQIVSPITSESGGEGSPERSIFKDTAVFIPLVTNSSGQATAEFAVPDNLTSWRITAVGVTQDVYAGSAKKNITVNLPFFVNQVVNLKYASNDDVVFSARALGDDEKFNGKLVEYTSTISGEGINRELQQIKIYGETVNFDYGRLPVGKYDIFIRAKCGDEIDAIRKSIYVINSLLEVDITEEIDLENKTLNISSLRFPVKLKFYDKNNELYYKTVRKIYGTSFGDTTDQIIARKLTSYKINEIENIPYEKEGISINQDYGGGVKILPHSEADVLLTAKICALAPNYLDISVAKDFFESILRDEKASSADVSAAYFGLAALKEPVLNDIKWILENDKGFDIEDKLNLVAGLAFIGDFNGANEYYNKILGQKMKTENDSLYMDLGNFDKNYEATCRVSMLLTKINNPDFKLTIKYILDNVSTKYTPALDLLTYILEYNPKKDSDGYIEYSVNGKKEKVSFSDKRVNVITLEKSDLENFIINNSKNAIGFAYYVGGIEDLNRENEIAVDKSYIVESKVGENGVITLNIKLPKGARKGYYTVTDVVPSGMRFVNAVKDSNNTYYLTNQENQKLYFSFYNETGEITIKYKVRSVLPGDYIVESAVASDYSGNITGYSKKGNVKINEA